MTLGLFLWMILIFVINSDMWHFIILGTCIVIGVICAIIEDKKNTKKDKRISRPKIRNYHPIHD